METRTELADLTELVDAADMRTKRDLLARLTYELERRADVKWNMEHRHVWEAMTEVCEGSSPPLLKYAERVNATKLRSDLDKVNKFVTQGCRKQLTMPERLAVLRLVMKCLADDIKRVSDNRHSRGEDGFDVRVATLLSFVDSLRRAVDRAFPGYWEAKMLDRVALTARIAA